MNNGAFITCPDEPTIIGHSPNRPLSIFSVIKDVELASNEVDKLQILFDAYGRFIIAGKLASAQVVTAMFKEHSQKLSVAIEQAELIAAGFVPVDECNTPNPSKELQ